VTAIRLSGEPAGPGEFAVDSATTPGEQWRVFWRTYDVAFCGCPSFTHRRRCRHLEQVALAIEVEARETVAAGTPETRAAAAARLDHIAKEFDL
jgi:hypothetical protein